MGKSGVAVAGSGGSAPVRRRAERAVLATGAGLAAPIMTGPTGPAVPTPFVAQPSPNGHDGEPLSAPVPPSSGQASPEPVTPAAHSGRPADPAPDWRPFLRALATEIDAVAGTAGRDALLRGVGLQLARMYPLPARESLDGLAMEMTETLDGLGWGSVAIRFSEREHCLVLTHRRLPRVGGAGNPPGTWLAGMLVGLYEGWMAQQPGTDGSFVARRVASAQPEEIVIRYGTE